MKVLFVTRKYPPSVGGMENLSYHLIAEMRRRVEVNAIAWGGSQKLLPLFLLYALAKSIWIGRLGVDLVHLGDSVIALIGWVLKRLFRVPVVVAVHGLDITFPSLFYQWLTPRLVREFDSIVCNSNATRDACIARGIPDFKCTVIHPGVLIPTVLSPREASRDWLAQALGKDLQSTSVLLTVGRLVPRKGVVWFVESVLPQVVAARPGTCYVVIGSGPEEHALRSAAARSAVKGQVYLLGRVPPDELPLVYTAADLFIMPNVPCPGDMEGFGLVALEAAAHGLPVLAADLEGIRDAVVPGQTGRLLPAGNASPWVEGVLDLLRHSSGLQSLGRQARATVQVHYTWSHMADEHEKLFRQVLKA